MFKVFFVEDEVIVRRGVKSNIQWEKTNYIFTGDAPDGEMALPLIRDIRPDILITDIKMPFMDGLELSRIVKKEFPWIKIIILSGHDEFKYAKEALSIGVNEYLLKPFQGSELIEVLDRISKDIEEERKRNLIDGKFPFNMEDFISELSPKVIAKCEAMLLEFLKLGERKNIEEFIESYLCAIREGKIDITLYYHYTIINFIMTVTKYLDEVGGNIETIVPRVNELEKISSTIDSLDALKNCLKNVVLSVMAYRDTKRRDKYGAIIEKTKNYINHNYGDYELSLNKAAAFVNVSPNHLSAIFSKETGETFIEYIIKIRLKKAKELLKGSNMRASEIAFAIGYSDPHYFSYIFKKYEKCTPNEYRNK